MPDHKELIKDCLRGKPQAQKQLYELFADTMLGVCYRYTKSIPDAEDVLQDGFVRVFTKLHLYRFEGELGGWIRQIMVRTALNYLKQNRKYQSELSFTDSTLHPVSHDHADLKLHTKELVELVRQLPTGYQTIFNLHAVEGFTHVEIGQMLGINEGTSRSQYSRARNLLITWVEKYSLDTKSTVYAGKRV
jgi:RNA polymerase sigma factor (sigma-70 family)